MSITQVLKYPLQDLRTFLKGLLLQFLYFLIIPLIIIFGYQIRVINHVINGKSKLPELKEFKKTIMLGVKSLLIHLIYLIPCFLVYSASMLSIYTSSLIFEPAQRGAYFSNAYDNYYQSPNYYASIILYYGGFFFIPAALCLFAHKWKFSDALKLKKALRIIINGFARYVIAFTLILLATQAVNNALRTVNLSIILPVFHFYIIVISAFVYGNIYKRVNKSKLISD